MGFALCLASFILVLRCSRHSLGRGLGGLLAVGYLYGILRARFPDGFSHVVFDVGTLGLYLGRFSGADPEESEQSTDHLRPLVEGPRRLAPHTPI